MLTPDQLTGKQKQTYEAQIKHAKKVFQVGVHDISNEDYHGSAGISKSGITLLNEETFYYWGEYLNPDRPKKVSNKSFELGNAVHTYLLENELFKKTYEIIPKFKGKGCKKAKEEFMAAHLDKVLIEQNTLEIILATTKAVKEHPKASLFLTAESQIEKSFFWLDEETGLLCKSRPDLILGNLTIDLKTTDKASKKHFARSIHNYSYYIQAAMMADAQKAVRGVEPEVVLFVACEPKYPFFTRTYVLGQPSIDKGREVYKEALLKAQACFLSGDWFGSSKEIEEIDIPSYAFY